MERLFGAEDWPESELTKKMMEAGSEKRINERIDQELWWWIEAMVGDGC